MSVRKRKEKTTASFHAQMIDGTKLDANCGTFQRVEVALICGSQNDYPSTRWIVYILQILNDEL